MTFDVREISIKGPLIFGDKTQIDEIKRFNKDQEAKETLCEECTGEGMVECPECRGSGQTRR